MAFVGDWFGMTKFSFFGVPPAYVKLDKQPGMSEVPKPTLPGWLAKSPFVLITSPNFIWAVVALLVYVYAPYDLSPSGTAAQAPLSLAFFKERLPMWLAITHGYVGFFHLMLTVLGPTLKWSTRPFIADRPYNLDKVAHNIFWSTSGIVIWTAFENVRGTRAARTRERGVHVNVAHATQRSLHARARALARAHTHTHTHKHFCRRCPACFSPPAAPLPCCCLLCAPPLLCPSCVPRRSLPTCGRRAA
jgi:hypothetical protein